MIKKILFVIFQFIIVKSFDIKKFTASVLLSSSLHNNLPLEDNHLQNTHMQLEQKVQNTYINEYSSSIRISNNDIYFYCNNYNNIYVLTILFLILQL
jgi:hypothetical protein